MDNKAPARQINTMKALCVLLLSFALVPPAIAQTNAVRTGSATPANTVSCAYDYMGPEDREIALLLLAREIIDGGKFRPGSKNVMAVDRLISEAQEKCLDRYGWSIARAQTASGYAMTAVLSEALDQAIASFELPIGPLNGFFAENRSQLANRSSLGANNLLRLKTYLRGQGWDKARDVDFALAGLYIETLMQKAQAAIIFEQAGGKGRQLSPRRQVPAGSATRGKL